MGEDSEMIKSLLCSLIVGVEKEQEHKIGYISGMSKNELQAQLTKCVIFSGLRRVLIQALIEIKQSANEQ